MRTEILIPDHVTVLQGENKMRNEYKWPSKKHDIVIIIFNSLLSHFNEFLSPEICSRLTFCKLDELKLNRVKPNSLGKNDYSRYYRICKNRFRTLLQYEGAEITVLYVDTSNKIWREITLVNKIENCIENYRMSKSI